MREFNKSRHILYTQALKNPSKLTEDDLLQLIVLYPFSQPLIFAYERRKIQNGEHSSNKSLALLYAPSSSWLWAFVNKEVVKENIPVAKMDFSFEAFERDKLGNPICIQADEDQSIALLLTEDIDLEEDPNEAVLSFEQAEREELDLLVHQGSVLANYFIFEDQEAEKLVTVKDDDSINKEEAEDISLYNDDLMPYSFRWWLHKTRLEYADTYQPFAPSKIVKSATNLVDFGKLDDTVLDQQIKHNIIHFQNPEDKLSEQVKNRPVELLKPKGTDFIIERFIREEPIIQPPSAENLNNENMARQSAEDNYVLVTETLADIYVNQGLYLKAIEVFSKLILKYPEKKSYFASRIKELEKNI